MQSNMFTPTKEHGAIYIETLERLVCPCASCLKSQGIDPAQLYRPQKEKRACDANRRDAKSLVC